MSKIPEQNGTFHHPEHTRLQNLAGVIVDVDDFLTPQGVNAWYELTRYIFRLAGKSKKKALQAVEKHHVIYGTFRTNVRKIDRNTQPDLYAAHYEKMVEEIMQLYRSSELELTRENLTTCVDMVIVDAIENDPEIYNFLIFLSEISQQEIPVIIMTGAYSLIAERLIERWKFSRGFAASKFLWEDGKFSGFEYVHNINAFKVISLIQHPSLFRKFVGLAWDEIIAFDDGKTAEELFKYTWGIQLQHPGEEPLELARKIAGSHREIIDYTLKILPEDVISSLQISRVRH